MCGRDGKVQVIVASPRRPVRISGDVFEKCVRHPSGRGWSIRWISTPGTLPGTPMPGFIAGARVTIAGKGEKHEIRSDRNGRFRLELLPDSYEVTVEAPGFEALERTVEVEIRGPIWLEDRPLDSSTAFDATSRGIARGSDEMELNLGLEKPDGE